MKVLACVAALSIAMPAMAADQFDLICKGRTRNAAAGAWAAVVERYRVDLATKKWCVAECSRVFDIAEVQTDRIVFRSKERSYGSPSHYDERVNRTTGDWHERYIGELTYTESEGTCEAAPFSGITVLQKF